MFGTGTAAIVSPVGNILYRDQMQAIPNSDDAKAVSQRLVLELIFSLIDIDPIMAMSFDLTIHL